MKTAVIEKKNPPKNKQTNNQTNPYFVLSTDSVEEDFVSDTHDEDELSANAVNEDQNVCITLLFRSNLKKRGS